MAIKLAFTSVKGGLCKTTSSLALADSLKRRKKKVLLIDMDPQGSASSIYQCVTDDQETLADMLLYDTPAEKCIQHLEMGDIIASDRVLVDADRKIDADVDRFYHLSDTCKGIEDKYDFIICDCPPGDGVLLGNVLSYVNYAIVPVTADRFGVQGMNTLPDVMNEYKKRINPDLKVLGVLIVRYRKRQNLTRDLEEGMIPDLAKKLDTVVFKTRIRESVRCQEAQVMLKTLYDYAPSSTTALDYEDFADEVLKMLKKR